MTPDTIIIDEAIETTTLPPPPVETTKDVQFKTELLTDGNYKVTVGKQSFTGKLDKGVFSLVTTTAEVSRGIRSDNQVHKDIQPWVNAKLNEQNNYTPLDTIGRFQTYLSKSDYQLYISIDGEFKQVTPEILSTIKGSMSKAEKMKLEITMESNPIDFGNRVMLYGPTGSGKTFDFLSATNQLVKDKKLDEDGIEIVTISDGFEDIDFLAHIMPSEKGITHVENRIVHLFREASKGKKIAILLDELNRGSRAFLNLILKMLDAVDGKTYVLNNFIKNEMIVVPIENVLFFATMNLGSKYVGTNALDEALLDRFNIIQYKGYSENVEGEIRKVGFGEFAKKVETFVEYVRDIHRSGEIRSPISTRGLKMWAEAFANTDKSKDALLATFSTTLIYRLISVDDIGMPNETEKMMIEKKLKELFV